MTSCTIIISHFESLSFLRACIRQIRKYKHPQIEQSIIICDQSNEQCKIELLREFNFSQDTTIHSTPPLYSGFSVDYLMRSGNIKTDYVCQLHVDSFPIHKNWLYLPIKLIEENNFSFVGQLHFWSRPTDTIYPPTPFFSMSPTFNVAKTETYKEMSLEAGFTRFHNRPQSGLEFKNNDWDLWAASDYNARGSDDDTVAFCWEDRHREHDKLGLAVTGYIQSSFGRIIEDLVFHFCSGNEARGVMNQMPELYQHYTKRINENYDNALIDEMINLAKANRPPELEILSRNYWDGKLKISSPPTEQLNKRIEELKQ